jgi:hypothetical protein
MRLRSKEKEINDVPKKKEINYTLKFLFWIFFVCWVLTEKIKGVFETISKYSFLVFKI